MVLRQLFGKTSLYQDKREERRFHQKPIDSIIKATEEGYRGLIKDYYYFNIIKRELELKKSDLVLDVGCSGGVFEILFDDYKFFGIDISPEAIDVANKMKKRYKLKAKFSIGDAEKLDFDDEYFDKVFCFATLHHLPMKSLENAISECHRVLKNNGIMISIEPNLLNPLAFYEHIFRERFSKNEFPYSPSMLEKKFRKFKQVRIKTIKYFPRYNKTLEGLVSSTPLLNLFGHKILIKAMK